ncbi:MAG TPA: caspase family protein [Thermoanaerobaculia bacterium]|nr:caspase family protein [Thermoanaerobaculia bacterium]
MTRSRLCVCLLLCALIRATSARAADRALVVGVEKYADSRVPETPGCVLDATQTAKFLETKYGFAGTAIKVLTNEQATAADIEKEFRHWLIEGTQPGDRVFFLYAGHGSQLPDDNGDEEDGLDETIAPYDVNPETGSGEIRDDVFDEMIAQLSGRRAVLVFDSCHSGTISRDIPKLHAFPRGGGARYLPRPDQFKALAAREATSYSIEGAPRSRDLKRVGGFLDSSKVKTLSGVVVISAAASTQRAYPLEVGGALRGALSYVFADEQQGSLPTLRDLKSRVTKRIETLQASGTLDGDQQPQFDVISTIALDDEPLFATAESAPAIALTNPISPMHLTLTTGENKTLYHAGEKVTYQITSDTAGYLYLLVFSRNDVATCIFPNDNDRDNQIAAGSHTIPRANTYEFPVGEPFGRDVFVALVTKDRINVGDKVDYTWGEVFQRLNLHGLQEAIGNAASARGVGVKATGTGLDPRGWQGATVVVESKP